MTIFKYSKSYLLPAVAAAVIVGCSTAQLLPKSEALLTAEQFYQTTSINPKVRQYAASELNKAGATLKSAAKAETEGEMAHFVYISNNQIKTAITVAETNVAKKRMREIKALKSSLQEKSRLERLE